MKKYIFSLLAATTLLSSCSDFLQRKPLDFADESVFFNKEEDLANFNNTFYKLFPAINYNHGGIYNADDNSDNQTSFNVQSQFIIGEKQIPLARDSEWKFETIRSTNYFIQIVDKKMSSGSITGDETRILHYLGECHFFRAYDYFRMLSTIGDAPIITTVLEDSNYDALVQASVRQPRNEVARFILKDLDRAITLLMEKAPEAGRLCRDAAYLMKARVALYEATWLKYHQGTALVPGHSKWAGAKTHPNFAFKGGSIESEYQFFFEEAYTAADMVASARELHKSYSELFDRTSTGASHNITDIKEVILPRLFVKGINGHSATHYLARTGGGTGYTNALVKTFLMRNGLPIYAAGSGYDINNGDTTVLSLCKDRDFRLTTSIRPTGWMLVDKDKNEYTSVVSAITAKGNQGSPTGYQLTKWVVFTPGQDEAGGGTNAIPVFRAAEAYLIYLEAYYERHNALDSKCTFYWEKLRERAGVDTDFNKTITATELEKEDDLATKSKNNYVSKTLYNIRRERRSEFIAEGMRFLDLKRWRSLDHMKNYHIEGFNLWQYQYKDYLLSQLEESVSRKNEGKYIYPFKVTSTSSAYNGYTFPLAHYLEPIPVGEILLAAPSGDVNRSSIYQNPGWSNLTSGPADATINLN